jgi:hypothetical protein
VKTAVLLQLVNGTGEVTADPSLDEPEATPTGPPLPADMQPAPTATPVLITDRPVPFPPNATPGPHDFFPLTGQHVLAQCAACHAEGRYQGTANQCADCHTSAMPAHHFTGTCDRCHATAGWTPASFDHTGAADCLSCHLPVRPAQHFEGQCSLCHTTTAWTGAVFNHATIGGTDCVACHQPPAGHWPAPCARCHGDNANWRNVGFDHSLIGGTDCATCHAPPPNHFSGQCRNCHTDTGNFRNASFSHAFPLDHGGANGNCATCHPGNPPQWTCANCHGAERMLDKHDDVAGFGANCTACHADGREHDD